MVRKYKIEIYIVFLSSGPFVEVKIESPNGSLPSVLLKRLCGAISSGIEAGKNRSVYLRMINYRSSVYKKNLHKNLLKFPCLVWISFWHEAITHANTWKQRKHVFLRKNKVVLHLGYNTHNPKNTKQSYFSFSHLRDLSHLNLQQKNSPETHCLVSFKLDLWSQLINCFF